MAVPDFSYKPDPTIIAAMQNANAQRMQQEQLNQQKKQQDFQMVKETTKAVSDMVSSMVQSAEARTTQNLVTKAKEILSKPEPAATIPSSDGLGTVPNPAVAERKKSLMDIAGALSPKNLGEEAAKAAFPDSADKNFAPQQGALELEDGSTVPAVFKNGKYYFANTDDLIPAERIKGKGFKSSVITDPVTGEVVQVTNTGKTTPIKSDVKTTEITDPLDLNVRQSNRLDELKKLHAADDLVNTNRLNLNTLNNLKTVQAEGTGALIGSLQSLRARGIAGEKGVLTEQDVQRTTGSPALARRFYNAFTKLALGEENEENIKEFNSAIAAVEKAAIARNKKLEDDAIKRAKSSKELSNVSEDLIRRNITTGTEAFDAPAPTAPSNPATLQEALKRMQELEEKARRGN